MKILIINDHATLTGGAELQALLLRERLRARGHDVRLFASRARTRSSRDHADYSCLGSTSPWIRTWLSAANPWAKKALEKALADFKPDVVHVIMFLTQLSPMILPLLERVPTLYHVQWYRPVCPTGTKVLPGGVPCRVSAGPVCRRSGCVSFWQWPAYALQFRLLKRWRHVFKLVVANSFTLRRKLIEEGISPVEVVYNCAAVQAPRGKLTSPPTAIYVGRLLRQKGVDLLVRAFARIAAGMPEARLYIAGEGPDQPYIESLARTLKVEDQVRILGNLPRAELERLYAQAWTQVSPSRWREPFNMATLEAMMRGLSVISSSEGGSSEIVQPGITGFLVPPGDELKLAGALSNILCDSQLAERMGRAARSTASRLYSDTATVDRFLKLYQTILA